MKKLRRRIYSTRTEIRGAQPVEQFITQLRVLAMECNYGVDVKEDMIRDRVVFGKSSQRVR